MNALSARVPARVLLLALPETTPTSIYGLHEIFSSVGVAWSELTGETTKVRRVETRIVTSGGEPIISPLGTPIVPGGAWQNADRADAIIVTDLALSTRVRPYGRWVDEAAWIRKQYEQGSAICSVCTGAVFLAEAGLLDGVDATTHWAVTQLFAAHYPRVKLHPERIICAAGPEHRIVTSGGASAWSDLALYLIARFCGRSEAMRIAKIFLIGDHSQGQLPFAVMSRTSMRSDAVISRCQNWLVDNYTHRRPVARMSALSGLHERTFKRRFRMATGYAPIDYVQALRIEEAKQMLEMTSEPTDAIAYAVGYADPAFFRRLFKRSTGVTPSRYRQRLQHVLRP